MTIVACASIAEAQTPITDIGQLDPATMAPAYKPPGYSPYAGRKFPTRVFWGDTHLHTSASMDAGAFGNRLGIEEAYRFARGEEVTASEGERVKLSRPLDFLVVADHSDNMGFFPALFAGKPEMLADPTGKRWYDMVQAGGEEGVKAALEIIDTFSRGTFPPALMSFPGSPGYRSAWEQIDRRGRKVQRARPLHRLHRLRVDLAGAARQQPAPRRDLPRRRRQGDPDRAVHHLPAAGSTTPEDLWKVLQAYEEKTGGRVLAIPHNGNLSQRHDVPDRDEPGDRQAAHARVRRDPRPLGAALRGDADQGRRRGAPVPLARTTSSPATSSGTWATST